MLIVLLSACTDSNIKNTEKSNKQELTENVAIDTSSESNYKKNIQISIDKNEMSDNLTKICLNPRKFGTEGEKAAINYLKGKLEEYGYTINIQDFPVYKQDLKSTHVKFNNDYFKENPYNSEILGTGKNIIAKTDNHSEAKKTIYITAHYDTTADTTGVIDNGTGVSVVLEVARQLKNYENPFNIAVVLFSGEEYFRTGSRAFVSNLTDKEKENAIGCINVDMVGEKDAGDLIMRANTGEHNILTLMINNQIENQLSILEGGYSDELSFYLGKIPAITLTNKNPKPSRAKEKDQFQYIDIDELKNTAHLIINFLTNFDNNTYDKFLNDRSYTSNKAVNNKDLVVFKPLKTNVVDGFKLININANLLENGYASETEYIYENENGKKYIITEKFYPFANPAIYSNYKVLENDYKSSHNRAPLYLVNEDSNSDTKIFYSIGSYFGEIKGDMSMDEAMNILKACYKVEYKRIFGE